MDKRNLTIDGNRAMLAAMIGIASVGFISWSSNSDLRARLMELEMRVVRIEAQREALAPQGAQLASRIEALELARTKHDVALEAVSSVQRGSLTHVHETRETLRRLSDTVAMAQTSRSRSSSGPNERQLSQHAHDAVATIRVNAPDGVAQFIMGEKEAADNVRIAGSRSPDYA